MGVYGMLAVGLAMFAFRYAIPADKWPEKWAKVSFWSMNIGLLWMTFATLLPLGVLQLYHSVNDGYYEALSLGYITKPGNALLEWVRMPGDVILIVGGVLPFIFIAYTAVRHVFAGPTTEDNEELPEDALYTVVAAESASEKG
jgi:nitric oxide reductase subunit B